MQRTLPNADPRCRSSVADVEADEKALLAGMIADDEARLARVQHPLRAPHLPLHHARDGALQRRGRARTTSARSTRCSACSSSPTTSASCGASSLAAATSSAAGSACSRSTPPTTTCAASKREPKRGCLSEAESLSERAARPPRRVRRCASSVGIVERHLGRVQRQGPRVHHALLRRGPRRPTRSRDRMGISVKTVYSKKHKIRSRLEALLVARKLAA